MRIFELLYFFLIFDFKGINTDTIPYSTVIQSLQEFLWNLEQRANELKDTKTNVNGILEMIDIELPKFSKLISKYVNNLVKDSYLFHTLQNFPTFSDSMKVLWNKLNQTVNAGKLFYTHVKKGLKNLGDDFKLKSIKEVDIENSPLLQEFIGNVSKFIISSLAYEFPTKNNDDSENANLNEFEKQCGNLAIEIADFEISKQISNRRRRAAAENKIETPCIKGNQDPHSSRFEVINWKENVDLNIPASVTWALLHCYQIQIAEGILIYSKFISEDGNGKFVEEFQQKETDLSLTSVWIRDKFHNKTIEYVNGSKGIEILGNRNEVQAEIIEVWMCDPDKYILGENTIRFSGIFQTCIENEYDLSPLESCSRKCKNYVEPSKTTPCSGSKCNQNSDKQLMRQKIQCKRLEGKIQVCKSNHLDIRYDWFLIGSQPYGKYPKNESCPHDIEILEESWRLEPGILMKIPQLCEVCLCSCNYPRIGKLQIPYFNTAQVVSNVENNEIVIGVKFQMKYNTIFTSIETGKLLPNGEIDESTIKWISPEMKSATEFVESETTVRLGENFDKIYLDDIAGLSNGNNENVQIVTGLGFRHHKDHLSLEIQFTQLNLKSKSLQPETSVWINQLDDHNKRKIQSFDESDDPTITSTASSIDLREGFGVKFSSASLEKTGGQIVVPYFDSQKVHLHKRRPLYGIGMIHKGIQGYGGFIAFKLNILIFK